MVVNIKDWDSRVNARAGDSEVHWHPPQRLLSFLTPGLVINANDTAGVVVKIAGSGRIRIVALVSAAGTLTAKYRLADHVTNQALNQPATVALVAATENILDIANNPGYFYLEVSIVNGAGASTVSYVDIFMTTEGN